MTLKPGLTTALVAAIVSVLVSVATAGLVLHRAGVSLSGESTGGSFDDAKIHDYLVKNPEVLVEMSSELDKRQAVEQDAQQKKAIGKNADKIFRSPETPVAANPDGDVTLVEFFDYNCGYCKRALPDVVKIVDEDKKVKLVLKELPIFGEDSEAAAKAALAAKKQGKYFEMHQKLFSEPGKANLEKALQVAQELGLDVEQLKKDMEDQSVKDALAENRALAEELGVQGTPYTLVGDIVVAGAPDDLYDQLTKKISEIRQNGCQTTC
ncbi:MAG TPA: DsbA family protein [Methyloceanibacter sp.]|jgi:protein-disulfide isomerase